MGRHFLSLEGRPSVLIEHLKNGVLQILETTPAVAGAACANIERLCLALETRLSRDSEEAHCCDGLNDDAGLRSLIAPRLREESKECFR
jgi:hypothetical protein